MARRRTKQEFTHRNLLATKTPGEKITDVTLDLPDGARLVLLVRSADRKSWVLRRRIGGRDSSVKLGEFPEIGIARAREIAIDIVGRKRLDPAVEGGTLRELLEAYADYLGDRPSARDSRWAARWLLGKDWEHELARKRARLVETHELTALLRTKAQAGATVSVNRARATLHAAFAWGAKSDNDFTRPESVPRFAITTNPVTPIGRQGKFEKARKVEIEQPVMNEIWQELEARGPVGAFGRLAILSVQRLRQLQAAEIVDGNKLLIRDCKGRDAREKLNLLPITPAMAAELRAGALDLPGGYKALSLSLHARGLRATDIRRTAETFLSEAGVIGEDRGHLLSHGIDRNPLVRKHYAMAQRLPRKAELLSMWESFVRPAVTGTPSSFVLHSDQRK